MSDEKTDETVPAVDEENLADAPEAVEADDAPEAPADPVAEFKARLRTLEGDWYVVHSYSGHEKRVKQAIEHRIESLHMEDYIFQVEVPMEEVAEIADRMVVMNRGKVYMDDTPDRVFAREQDLREIGLGVPNMTRLISLLNRECFSLPMGAYTVERAFAAIKGELGGGSDAS